LSRRSCFNRNNQMLAWKEMFYGNMTDKEKEQLVAEVNILRELRHPNIVSYIERIVGTFNVSPIVGVSTVL